MIDLAAVTPETAAGDPTDKHDLIEMDEPRTAAAERRLSAWDIQNAPRNYISLVAAQAGSALFSFAAVWLITRYLGSEGYGGIVAVIAASQVAQVMVNWTNTAVVRFGVDEFIETEQISRTFWVRLIILAANLALVAAAAGLWYPPLAGWLRLPPGAFWLVIGHFAVTALWIHVQSSLQAAKLPRKQGWLLTIERAAILASIVVLLAFARLDWRTAIWCYIAAPAVMTAIGLYELRHYITASFTIDRPFLKRIVAYSLPLLPFSLVGYFSGSYVDAVFISNYLSTRDLGIYSVATQAAGTLLQLPTIANNLLLPLFVSLQRELKVERTNRYFKDVLPSITLLWGCGVVLIGTLISLAVKFLFSNEFHVVIPTIWILFTSSVAFFPLALGFSAMSNSLSRTHIALVGAIVSASTNLVGNFVLIPTLGMLGCAWATAISVFFGSLTHAVMLRNVTGNFIFRPLAATIPSIAGALLLSMSGDYIWAVAAFGMVTLVVGFGFRSSLRQAVTFFEKLSST
jgi:O-antigen/teichoic acid export membrane protein